MPSSPSWNVRRLNYEFEATFIGKLMITRTVVASVLLAVVLLASTTSAHATEVNPALLDSWERTWNYTTSQTTRRFLGQVNRQFLLALERDERRKVQDDIRRIIAAEISWERLGDRLVESMVAACGNELLENIAPYVGVNQFGDADRAVVEAYTACYATAMRETMEAIPLAISAKFAEIDTLLRSHGIDPDAESSAKALPPGVTPALAEIWSADWNRRMGPMVDEFAERYEEPLFQAFSPDEAELALEEIRSTLQSVVAWEDLSPLVIDEILSQCGRALLETVEPYLTSSVNLSDTDKDLANEYASCYDEAASRAQLLALYSIAEDRTAEIVLSKYNDALANYQRISPTVTTAKVEERYGPLLDEVAALHNIRSEERQRTTIENLKRRLESESAIIHVSLEDPGYPHTVYGELFHFYQGDEQPTGKSCHGASPPEQERLNRCSWNSGKYSNDNVISYSRKFVHGSEELGMAIEFDYDALLREFAE